MGRPVQCCDLKNGGGKVDALVLKMDYDYEMGVIFKVRRYLQCIVPNHTNQPTLFNICLAELFWGQFY